MTTTAYLVGSNDYSGYFAAIGESYQFDKQQSFRLFVATDDSDYDSDQNLVLVTLMNLVKKYCYKALNFVSFLKVSSLR